MNARSQLLPRAGSTVSSEGPGHLAISQAAGKIHPREARKNLVRLSPGCTGTSDVRPASCQDRTAGDLVLPKNQETRSCVEGEKKPQKKKKKIKMGLATF